MLQKRFQVTFEPAGKTVEVDEGSTILDAARAIDISLNHVCGGACACATCHVFVEHGFEHLQAQSDEEIDMLSLASSLKFNSRLACQTEVLTDITVAIPSDS